MFLYLLAKIIIDPIIDPAEAHLSHCAGGNLAFTLLPICPDPSHPNNLIHLFLVKNNCLNDNSTWPRIFRETLPSPTSILSSLVMRIRCLTMFTVREINGKVSLKLPKETSSSSTLFRGATVHKNHLAGDITPSFESSPSRKR